MNIKDFVKDSMIQAFLDENEEFKYYNVYLEYTNVGDPYFYVVKECDEDPQICGGVAFFLKDYFDRYWEKWMNAMIDDISREIEKNLDNTPLERKLEIIRHQVFELGKIQ